MKAQTRIQIAFIIITLAMAMAGCAPSGGGPAAASGLQCRGAYTTTNAQGQQQNWDQHPNAAGTACLTDSVPLTQWQSSLQDRTLAGVTCVPQAVTATLVAQGNYYSYRDGRERIDLDGSTGVYRRVYTGVTPAGRAAFTRELGCFYTRYDPVNGQQLFLDSSRAASTELSVPTEIYRMDRQGQSWLLTRNDDTSDWTYDFCPTVGTQEQYCAALRNGNYMYEPTLDAPTQAALLGEAILIRTKFSYAPGSHPAFMAAWGALDATTTMEELGSVNWQYQVKQAVDTPRYTDPAWRAYVMGQSDEMPDAGSPDAVPVCYSGRQPVTEADGTQGAVYGEICYEGGQYAFTTP